MALLIGTDIGGRLVTDLPPGWEARRRDDGFLLADPRVPGFAPNLVSLPATPADVERMTATLDEVPDSVLLDDAEVRRGGLTGRRIVFAYAAPGLALTVAQEVLVSGTETARYLTATMATAHFGGLWPTVSGLLNSIRMGPT